MQLPPIINHCNSRRVIAAIFQSLQPFNEQRLSHFPTDISDNSTHLKSSGKTPTDMYFIGPNHSPAERARRESDDLMPPYGGRFWGADKPCNIDSIRPQFRYANAPHSAQDVLR